MTSKTTSEGTKPESAGAERVIDMDAGRRAFLRSVGIGAAAGAAVLQVGAGLSTPAQAVGGGPSDADILNFALNLEYLEAEFYLRAVGRGLADADTTGKGQLGPVIGGRRINFKDNDVRLFAEEIATDEENHVQFLRQVLGNARVARPKLDLNTSFTAAARAAGLVGPNENFDPYANDTNFLLGAFIFEDVGVTAYKGAAPLINSKEILSAAAGILAVEAYHAGLIRTLLFGRRLFREALAISSARDSLDGPSNKDQGIGSLNMANIIPADRDTSIVFDRTPRQVLNIVYLESGAEEGGFFPNGVNGPIQG